MTKKTNNTNLVGGLEHVLFFHIGNNNSKLTNSYFSEGWLNHQPANTPTG
jgi:hypothetical protein